MTWHHHHDGDDLVRDEGEQLTLVADLEVGGPQVSDETSREVWWCKTHESRFLEKQPSKYALCLLSLHERNFEAIGWEDCEPVLVRVVPVPVREPVEGNR